MSKATWQKGIIACVCTFLIVGVGCQVTDSNRSTQKTNHLSSSVLDQTSITHRIKPQTIDHYGQIPLGFEQNKGQLAAHVKFFRRGKGYTTFLTNEGAVLSLSKHQNNNPTSLQTTQIKMGFGGVTKQPVFKGQNKLSGKINYLSGRDQNRWHTHVPLYEQVKITDLYPGIDAIYYEFEHYLEYDLVVKPGANVDTIALTFEGIDSFHLNQKGDLLLKVDNEQVIHRKPIIYQIIKGIRHAVEGEYVLQDNQQVGFQVAAYDPHYALIIDPILDYSSYLGGEAKDVATDIAVDDSGHIYVTGTTHSLTFPTAMALQPQLSGSRDSFVVKLSPSGDSLIYATYIGGTGGDDDSNDIDIDDDLANSSDDNDNLDTDKGNALAVNSAGEVFIVGKTDSAIDFPSVNAYQPNYGGGKQDGYLIKLSSDGSTIQYATLLGGNKADVAVDVAVDALDQAVVVGHTRSSGFPLLNPIQSAKGGRRDGFISKFSADGSQLIFSTFLGGSKQDRVKALALDHQDNIHIAGFTRSDQDFPLLNALQTNYAGGNDDGFIAGIASDGSNLLYATYHGGNSSDKIKGIALDSTDHIVITGQTKSTQGFPLVNPWQAAHAGKLDAFISKLSPNGSSLVFSTYFGAAENEKALSIDLDQQDQISIVGLVRSPTLPTVNPIQAVYGGAGDAFISQFSADGSQLLFSTFLGGNLRDKANALVIDGWDNMTVAGVTKSSTDFPLLNPLQSVFGGDRDGFVVRLSADNLPPLITSNPVITAVDGMPYSYDVNATDPDQDSLAFSLSSAPPGMNIDSITGLITWLPTAPGLVTVNVLVEDGRGGSDSQSFQIDVLAASNAPVITSQPATTAQIDALYQYAVTTSDPNGDLVSLQLTQAPLGMQLDSSSGIITWTPAAAGNVNVSLKAQDPGGLFTEQHFSITVNYPSTNQPPQWQTIGDQTAPLGATLTLQLTAVDLEGGPISFSANPKPLPLGMQLNAASGIFTFTPTLAQVGLHTVTFIASDGRFTQSETITINVPQPSGITRQSGQVLTTNGAPLANVRLEIAGIETLTDNNGNYLLDNLPVSGDVRLLVDGATVDPALGVFATVPEIVNLIAGADNRLTPAIILLPLDVASADPVNPLITSIITSSQFSDGVNTFEPVTLTIPAGAAIDDQTGQPFVGDIHISRIEDPTQGPRPLPADIDLSFYIAIQPFGVTYPTPVPISFPNVESFPSGSLLDIFALDHDTGNFEKIGEGLVSADGKTVDSIGGIVKSNSWHGFVAPPPIANPGKDPDNDQPKLESDPECGKTNPGCSVDKETGNLGEWHVLPPYYSLAKPRVVKLEYNSVNASPKPIVPINSDFGFLSPPPDVMSLALNVGGVQVVQEHFADTIAVGALTRSAVQFDAFAFQTGVYDYQLDLNCYFVFSRRARFITGQVIVHNETQSPFGAGWTLAGLQRIYLQTDGKLLLLEGDETSKIFNPIDAVNYQSPAGDYSTMIRNANGSFTRTLKDGHVIEFDTSGLQTAMIDRNANQTDYTYDASGQLTRITDPVGKFYQFNYFSSRIRSIVDPDNRITRFQHDSEGNLISIVEPNGDSRRFEYQPGTHLLNAQTDQRNNRKEYGFDFAGRFAEARLPDGSTPKLQVGITKGLIDLNTTSATRTNPAPPPPLLTASNNVYEDHNGNISEALTDDRNVPTVSRDGVGRRINVVRDGDSNPTSTTRPNQSLITRSYDNRGNVLTQTEQFNGAVYQYAYDAFSLLTSATNPRNHTTTITRDISGNATTIVNHLGHTTLVQYDGRGLMTRLETANGLVSTYTYTPDGLVATITETPPTGSPGGIRLTQFSYDQVGQTIQVITPDNIVLDLAYDIKGRVVSVTDNLGQSIEYGYDGYDNLISQDTRNSGGTLALTVARAFDSRNRLIEIRSPHTPTEDSVVQRILDGNSNLIGSIDPNGNSSSRLFDGEDRLIESTHRLNGISHFTYDTNNRIIKVIAPNGVTTTYFYDLLGRRRTEISSDRGTLVYGYDLANNVTSITDGRGITVTMTYDELERVNSKTFPNTLSGKTEDVTYNYDTCAFGIGYLCDRTDESGQYAYDYDAFGNVVSINRTELGVSYTTEYVYDEGDHITQMTYPGGRIVDFGRDGIRRIESIDAVINNQSQSIVSGIQYRGDNRMTQCTYGNGLIDDRSYDLQGRLFQQTLKTSGNQIIDDRQYSFDLNSNILNRTTTPQTSNYNYDALDRIVGDTIDAGQPFDFSYDLNDNRFRRTQGSTLVEDYQFFATGSNRLTQKRSVTTNPPAPIVNDRELVFNDANRLFQIVDDGVLTAEYIYNDQGQRTRKIIFNAGIPVQTILFHYDQMGYLISESDELGNLKRDYIWSEGMIPMAQIDRVGSNDSVSYLHTDHLMTNRLATNQNQSVVWRWEGEAFGNSLAQELAGVSINLRFPGQYVDAETGLFYNYYRYYDPSIGRYITSDPIGLQGGLNTYGYTFQNPVNFSDPDGLFACGGLCIASGIFALINAYDTATDIADTAETLGNQCSSTGDKAAALGLLALGIADPLPGNFGKKFLTKLDLGLSQSSLRKLEGTIIDADTTRIISVDNIRGQIPIGELRNALPNIIQTAKEQGKKTLQIEGTFGNDKLERFVTKQAQKLGGSISNSNGKDTITFILGSQ